MLLETSHKGADVELDRIPKPEGVDFIQWLKAYQGCGFVVTCRQEHAEEVIKLYKNVGLTSKVAGEITKSAKLNISDTDNQAVLFDFESDVITGCKN